MSWKETTIPIANSSHFETLNGLWKGKKEPFIEAGVIRNTNFTPSGVIDYTNVAYLDVEEKQLSKRQLKSGDIIIERSGGGPKQPVGRVVFFDREDGVFSFSNFTSAVRVRDESTFDPRFVFYGLMEIYQSGQTEDIQRRTTGIRNLDFTAYKERARLPQIPLPEQKNIAHILSTVQRAIEAQERIIQTTTKLKNALMHKLFTKGLRNEPQKQTEIGLIPESWEICTVPDSLQKTRVGRRQQIPAKEIAETGVHPVVDQGQTFVSGFTDDSERLIDFDLPLIIFGDHTRHFKFVDFPFVLGADGTKVLKPKPGLFDPKFFFYALVVLKLPSRGYNRHFKILKEKIIPRPSIEEQREIANAIDAIENKAKLAESKRSTLNDLFRTLLHELMTAKIRVHNLIA